MVVDKIFYELFSDYFRVYLPQFKKRSEHTIRSYRAALNSLLDFVAADKRVKLAEITFEMIDTSMIAKYLTSLDEQGNSLTTRNLRLNCIKAFFSYAAEVNYDEYIYVVGVAIAFLVITANTSFGAQCVTNRKGDGLL